jgi:hypothetical protein
MNRQPRPQDISWFLDQERNNQLNLSPPYQRKSAWTPKDRRAFLDTIFRNYPCPAIFLHKEIKNGKTVYNVVDGKQRLETIIGFANGIIAIDKEFGDSRLDGKKFDKLDEALRRAFWNYTLPVEMIDFEGTEQLKEVFSRLNRNARKLEAQEIRHSQFDGWLMSFVATEAEEAFWRDLKISTKANARRMKDHQFISELLLVVIEKAVHGFDQDWLNECYAVYDVPDDPDSEVTIDLENIQNEFAMCRDFIRRMEVANHCVTLYASTFASFYTLWSWVALERGSKSPESVAGAYANFMLDVESAAPSHTAAEFAKRLKGASTDYEPRIIRNNILKEILK